MNVFIYISRSGRPVYYIFTLSSVTSHLPNPNQSALISNRSHMLVFIAAWLLHKDALLQADESSPVFFMGVFSWRRADSGQVQHFQNLHQLLALMGALSFSPVVAKAAEGQYFPEVSVIFCLPIKVEISAGRGCSSYHYFIPSLV